MKFHPSFSLFLVLLVSVILFLSAIASGQRQISKPLEIDIASLNEDVANLNDEEFFAPKRRIFTKDSAPFVCNYVRPPVDEVSEANTLGALPTAIPDNRTTVFLFFNYADKPASPPQTPDYYVNSVNGSFGKSARDQLARASHGRVRFVGANGKTTPDAFGYFKSSLTYDRTNPADPNRFRGPIDALAKLTTAYQHLIYMPTYGVEAQGFASGYRPGDRVAMSNFATQNEFNFDLSSLGLLHELGHNLGFSHANELDCSATGGKIARTCTRLEYFDSNDIMGFTGDLSRLFSTSLMYYKRWLDDSTVRKHQTTASITYLLTSPAIQSSITSQTGKVFAVHKYSRVADPFDNVKTENFSTFPKMSWTYAIEHSFQMIDDMMNWPPTYIPTPQVHIHLVQDPFTIRNRNQGFYPPTYSVKKLTKVNEVFADSLLNLRVQVNSLNRTHANITVSAPF